MNNEQETTTVCAPIAGGADRSGQLISVEIHEDEEVQWQWAHSPDGKSAVVGYEIVKKNKRSIN